MNDVCKTTTIGSIGLVTIDSPPVNALGAAVRKAIVDGINDFIADPAVEAIVLNCAGRTFFAGADITEFGKPPHSPSLVAVLATVEASTKPVIAAIHGTALGGGFELALACNWRIAVPSAKVGLPEVNLGILPGAGGTQRLPRIVGVSLALEMITSGTPVAAPQALTLGLLDELAQEGRLVEDAVEFARKVVAEKRPLVRVRDREDQLAPHRGNSRVFEDFLQKNAKRFRGLHAPANIVKAVQAAVELPFDDGLKRERALFQELQDGPQSAALRYRFFAERQTNRITDVPTDTPTLPVRTVGVIGAGTMGGGIAMNFLNAGVPVILVEMSQEALDRGIGVIRRNYENTARKGRLTQDQVEQRMALISPALSYEALAEADLIIEAVFEEMSVKKDVFTKIDSIARQGAILASNTSYLDIDEIAACTSRPEDVVGLHFFSPANVMRLLEVVRGRKTRVEVIATAMALARTIGKVPVLARVCYGFIANRVMTLRGKQAEALVLRGPSPQEIDRALYDYGFAMGPFQMMDLVGLDVTTRGATERNLRSDLVAAGRLGQKKNGGFYDYDEDRNPTPSPEAAAIIAEMAKFKGIQPTGPMSPDEIVAYLLYPVVNECARVIEEGIALRPSDVDVACLLGYNWPAFTGGPLFWADTIGLEKVVAGLRTMGMEPAALLVDRAESGERITGA